MHGEYEGDLIMNIQNAASFPKENARSGQSVLVAGYMSGFGNGFETEALAGALPIGRNSPQKCSYGLYAEQLSGSPFTAPRASNERSWLYRIRPTVHHWGAFKKADAGLWRTAPAAEIDLPIAPMRWDPIPIPSEKLSFVEGVRTITTAGDAGSQAGMGAHVYLVTRPMVDEYFYNADGEMLFVPQQGKLRLATEFGIIEIEPGEISVIPRGVKLRVELVDGPRAAISARIMEERSGCLSAARSVRTASPIRAIFSRPWPLTRTGTRHRGCT
jgi:homogentisate 1,2-dioxygenase